MSENARGGHSPGCEYRMARLFPEGGAAIICPIDHGLYLGRVRGLEIQRRCCAAYRAPR